MPAIANKYTKDQSLNVMASNGYNNGTLSGDGAYVLYNRLGACNHISFTVKTAGNLDKFGISVVRATDSKKYYTMVVNPENDNWRKVNFEEEGSEGRGFIRGIDGYGFARPADNTYKVDIYTDNSVLVMYIWTSTPTTPCSSCTSTTTYATPTASTVSQRTAGASTTMVAALPSAT